MQNLDSLTLIEEKENKPMCISSNPVSDYCDLKGDIRIHGNSSTIYISSSDRSILAGNSTWNIKPYPRKGNEGALKNVRQWTLKLVQDSKKLPSCTRIHNVPAIIFSLSGYTHNLFHDFTDVLIPLFSNTWKFDGQVHFLNTDYRPLWISRFQAVLDKLSRHPVVNIDNEKEIRCYRNVIVGLERDKALDIDPSRSVSGVTMKDFRRFIGSTYSLNRSEAIKLKEVDERKPHLMLISRQKRRKWRNLDEITEVAQSLGFDVVVGDANRTSSVSRFAHIVNSCDLIMGVHGAGLANMVFLPDEAVVIQVIPLGALEAFAKETFEDPTKDMNLRYLKYKIKVKESSLIEIYRPNDPVIKDPLLIHKQGWEAIQATYLDEQDITLDMKRFRHTLVEALDLLHR